jgi:hypothetical protein
MLTASRRLPEPIKGGNLEDYCVVNIAGVRCFGYCCHGHNGHSSDNATVCLLMLWLKKLFLKKTFFGAP